MDKKNAFESLLQQQPIVTPIRTGLKRDTLKMVVQAKRSRRIGRILGALAAIATFLLIAKWLMNDITFFIQIAATNFQVISEKGQLYWSAFWESIPVRQLFTAMLAAALWLGWRRLETFYTARRITSVKKGIAMKIIHFTPRLSVASVLIGIVAIGFSGYGYAQIHEQKKLELLREHVNESGRTEFQTNRSASACQSDINNQPNQTNTYEIKKNSGLSSADAAKVLQASCYQAEAEKDLTRALHYKMTYSPTEIVDMSFAVEVVKLVGNQLTYLDGTSKNRAEERTISVTSSAKVINRNETVKLTTLKPGMIILPLIRSTYADMNGGSPTSRTILGIAVLPAEPAFKYYSPYMQNKLTQIQVCAGNPADRCSFTGGVDFFPSGGGEDNTINPAFKQAKEAQPKEISGAIIEIRNTGVTIKSSSGRLFTLEFDSDPITAFNQNRSQYYEGKKVTVGDTLLVSYSEPDGQHATTLHSSQIASAVLLLEIYDKYQPIEKY